MGERGEGLEIREKFTSYPSKITKTGFAMSCLKLSYFKTSEIISWGHNVCVLAVKSQKRNLKTHHLFNNEKHFMTDRNSLVPTCNIKSYFSI